MIAHKFQAKSCQKSNQCRFLFVSFTATLAISTILMTGCASTLHDAIRSGDSEAVQAAIETGDVNQKDKEGNTPLILAVKAGNPDFTAWLLRNGAEPNVPDASGMYPIHYAATLKPGPEQLEIIQSLTGLKANPLQQNGQGMRYIIRFNL